MRLSTIFACQVSLILSLMTLTELRAGEIQWTYDWSRIPADVVSADVAGTSRITLTDEPPAHVAGSSNLIATYLQTSSNTPGSHANHFLNAAYSLSLSLTDEGSGESGSLTFSGVLNGTLSSGSADLANQFTALATQGLILGGNEYLVTVGDYTPPGPPGSSQPGSISAMVEVRPGLQVSSTPEPSTIALTCLGLSVLAIATRRKRRGAEAPAGSA